MAKVSARHLRQQIGQNGNGELYMTSQQRQTLMITIAVILLIAFGWLIVWFYTLASLTITTNSASNTILVREKTATSQNQVSVSQSGKQADLRVVAGTYIVTVQNATRSSSQVVKLGTGEHKNITINLDTSIAYSTSEPVTSMGAGSISASKDTLRFIDRNTANSTLYSVDATGTISVLDSSTRYVNISWADPLFGLGYGLDKNNRYVITKIEGNFATQLKMPFVVDVTSSVRVAPNRTWYVSDGNTVYRGNADGSFTKVYSSTQKLGIIAVSNDALLLWQKPQNNSREGNMVILHTDGNKYQIKGGTYEAAWSPSGKKLVTSGDVSEIFDDKFQKIGILPSGNFISPLWLDENTLLYGMQNSVVRYDIQNGTATPLITFDDTTGKPSQIKLSNDRDYLYVAIQKAGNRSSLAFKLDRIPLQNQQPSNLPVQKFSLLIPNTVGGCDLNYMNFIRFSVITKSVKPSTNCVPAVKSYFASYSIGTTDLSFQQIN